MFEGLAGILGSSFERAPWGWGVLIVLVGFAVRLQPIMAKLALQRDESVAAARAADNADLKKRVAALESRLETDRVIHEAEQARDRHKINNLMQCLDALFMMLELAPEKAAEHVTKIRAMRAEQMRREADEKAAIHTAAIVAAGARAEEPTP